MERVVSRDRPRIGTVIGDPTGIGPEVIVRALASGQPGKVSRPLLIGSIQALEAAAAACDVRLCFRAIEAPEQADGHDAAIPVIDDAALSARDYAIGVPSFAAALTSYKWLQRGITFAEEGRIDGLIMGPLDLKTLEGAGIAADDLAFEPANTYQLRINGPLRVVPLTEHIPLRDVPATVTTEHVLDLIRACHQHLVRWGLPSPRIGVAGLNPHAMFEEDAEAIEPAVAIARAQGLKISGPFAPDAIFREALGGSFDAVCTMYHDQGQIAVKTFAFEGACTVFLGLQYGRVGIPHGTAHDLAGKGKAQHGTMLAAMMTIASLVSGRGFPSISQEAARPV